MPGSEPPGCRGHAGQEIPAAGPPFAGLCSRCNSAMDQKMLKREEIFPMYGHFCSNSYFFLTSLGSHTALCIQHRPTGLSVKGGSRDRLAAPPAAPLRMEGGHHPGRVLQGGCPRRQGQSRASLVATLAGETSCCSEVGLGVPGLECFGHLKGGGNQTVTVCVTGMAGFCCAVEFN